MNKKLLRRSASLALAAALAISGAAWGTMDAKANDVSGNSSTDNVTATEDTRLQVNLYAYTDGAYKYAGTARLTEEATAAVADWANYSVYSTDSEIISGMVDGNSVKYKNGFELDANQNYVYTELINYKPGVWRLYYGYQSPVKFYVIDQLGSKMTTTGEQDNRGTTYVAAGEGVVASNAKNTNEADPENTYTNDVESYIVSGKPDTTATLKSLGYTEREIEDQGLTINWYNLLLNAWDGWHIDGVVVDKDGNDYKNKPTYQVTFKSCSGYESYTEGIDVAGISAGTSLTDVMSKNKTATTTNKISGYAFDGKWYYLDSDNNKVYVDGTETITDDLTLYPEYVMQAALYTSVDGASVYAGTVNMTLEFTEAHNADKNTWNVLSLDAETIQSFIDATSLKPNADSLITTENVAEYTYTELVQREAGKWRVYLEKVSPATFYVIKPSSSKVTTNDDQDDTAKYVTVGKGTLTAGASNLNEFVTGTEATAESMVATLPTDDEITATLTGLGYTANEIEAEGLTINWYHVLINPSDGWHVDGVVVDAEGNEYGQHDSKYDAQPEQDNQQQGENVTPGKDEDLGGDGVKTDDGNNGGNTNPTNNGGNTNPTTNGGNNDNNTTTPTVANNAGNNNGNNGNTGARTRTANNNTITPAATVTPVAEADDTTDIEDEETAKADSDDEVASVKEIEDEATPEAAAEDNCYIHWIALALTLLFAAFAVVRVVVAKKAEEDEKVRA